MTNFEIAGGSTIGRDHRVIPRNNQDSWIIRNSEDVTVCIVADGCGSGSHSEMGAQLGTQLLSDALLASYSDYGMVRWAHVQQHVVSHIDMLARAMGGRYRWVVENYFLFTIVGVVLDTQTATFFALGDGTTVINGVRQSLGPFTGNMPPYLGYTLLEDELKIDRTTLQLTPFITMPIDLLDSFMIATDGVDDVITHSQHVIPGSNKLVGPIEQFWQNDRYFGGNSELVSRQLKLFARDWPVANPTPGLLSDDTTLIVGRRS